MVFIVDLLVSSRFSSRRFFVGRGEGLLDYSTA